MRTISKAEIQRTEIARQELDYPRSAAGAQKRSEKYGTAPEFTCISFFTYFLP